MQSTPGCLTRVVVGDEREIEVAALATALQRIQAELRGVPAAQREYIANALLVLAVSKVPACVPEAAPLS
jgi:hypothetical protein